MQFGIGWNRPEEKALSAGGIAVGTAAGAYFLKNHRFLGGILGALAGYGVLAPIVGVILYVTLPAGSLAGPLSKNGEA
jgi:hypothetical protein